MGQNNLDHYIKSRLDNHYSSIDNDELWNGIQTKKRKLAFLSYGFVIIIALILSFLIYGLLFTDNSSSGFVASVESSTKNSDNKTLALSQNQASDLSMPMNIVESHSEDLNIEEDERATTTLLNRSTHSSSESRPASITSHPSKSSLLSELNNKTLESNLSDGQSHNYNATNNAIDELEFSSAIQMPYKLIGNSAMSPVQTIPSNLYLLNKDINMPLTISSTDCPTFGSKKNRIFGEVYTTMDYAAHSYNTSIENQSYLNERSASQKYRPSFSASAQLKYLFHNGFFVKAGLEYGIIREKFTFRKETVTTEIRPDQIINIHIDMNGDTTITLGNAPVTTIETKNWKVKNSYKTFGIPISVGYQIERGPWFYSLDAGVVYNLKFAFKGMLLDNSLEPIDGESYFKNKVGLSLHLNFTAGYMIAPNLNFVLKANVRSLQNNINSTLNLIDQKYNLIGSGVGIEYEF